MLTNFIFYSFVLFLHKHSTNVTKFCLVALTYAINYDSLVSNWISVKLTNNDLVIELNSRTLEYSKDVKMLDRYIQMDDIYVFNLSFERFTLEHILHNFSCDFSSL